MYDCAEQATPWTANHWYGVGDRCTNDTDKTYQCISDGRSAGSGGPTGTGSSITDGSCEWQYIEASDATNNWCHWPNTVYGLGDLVSWDTGKIYQCVVAGTSAAANPPIGTAPDIVDGTVRWSYYATILANRTLYGYQFVLPPDCMRALKIPDQTKNEEADQGVQYSVEGRFLFCDQAASILKYVYRAEPAEWDSLLQATVAVRIAAEIALDITGQQSIMERAFAKLNDQYSMARMIAMNEGQEGVPEMVRWEEV